MPKILFLTDSLSNGGAERQMILLARNIPTSWDISIWSLGGGPFLEQIIQTQIKHKISLRKFRFDVSPIIDLYKLVQDYKPDIIHSWGWMSTLSGIFISNIFKVPLVNGIIRSGKPYYYRGSISKLLSKWGDVVLSNSESGLKNWGVNPTRGVVIHNGFDLNRLTGIDQVLKYSPNKDEIFRVVMAARMVKAKDFSLFISAARKVAEKGMTNWKFLAIGQGEDKASLIKENTDLIQAGILEFPEAGLEIIPFLQMSNVGVLLTRSSFHEEGCSNTIMEFMACGLPVVATDNGGNKELIDNQGTGFIIPDSNLEALISKLFWLFNNQDQAIEMGRRGQKKLKEQFSIEQMVERTINLYDSLLEDKGNR